MSEEPKNKNKNELLKLLVDVEKTAPALEEMGQDIVRAARLSRDVASCFRNVVSNIPNDDLLDEEHWKRNIYGWKAWHNLASDVGRARTSVNSFVASSTSTTVTTSGIMFEIGFVPQDLRVTIETAKTQFAQIVERTPMADTARASMRRLRLDIRGGGKRTALELLDEAQGALDHPSARESGAVSVLVTLRECLNTVLSELLRRRPKQESAPRAYDKVVTIGGQCGRPGLLPDHFIRLGRDAGELLDRLSAAKQANMSRERMMELFHEGLLFLNALMDSIDENRLRPV